MAKKNNNDYTPLELDSDSPPRKSQMGAELEMGSTASSVKVCVKALVTSDRQASFGVDDDIIRGSPPGTGRSIFRRISKTFTRKSDDQKALDVEQTHSLLATDRKCGSFNENMSVDRTPSLPPLDEIAKSEHSFLHSPLAGDIHVSVSAAPPPTSKPEKEIDGLDESDRKLLSEMDRSEDKTKEDVLPPSASKDFDLEGFDDEDLDSPTAEEPYVKRTVFLMKKRVYVPSILFVVLLTLAILARIKKKDLVVANFPAWRWLIFFSSTLPVYLVCKCFMLVVAKLMEMNWFESRRSLFYYYAIETWLRRTLCISVVTIQMAIIFQGYAHLHGGSVRDMYDTLLRLFGCFTLFSFGMILKCLAAKMLIMHSNRSAYYPKMQDALKKEYYLLALSQPRAKRLSQVKAEQESKFLKAMVRKPFRMANIGYRNRFMSTPTVQSPSAAACDGADCVSPTTARRSVFLSSLRRFGGKIDAVSGLPITNPDTTNEVSINVDAVGAAGAATTSPGTDGGMPFSFRRTQSGGAETATSPPPIGAGFRRVRLANVMSTKSDWSVHSSNPSQNPINSTADAKNKEVTGIINNTNNISNINNIIYTNITSMNEAFSDLDLPKKTVDDPVETQNVTKRHFSKSSRMTSALRASNLSQLSDGGGGGGGGGGVLGSSLSFLKPSPSVTSRVSTFRKDSFVSHRHRAPRDSAVGESRRSSRQGGGGFIDKLLGGGKTGTPLAAQSSQLSETHKSLASLDSLLSVTTRKETKKGRKQKDLPDNFPEEDAHSETNEAEASKGGKCVDINSPNFMERITRIEEHILRSNLRINVSEKFGASCRNKEYVTSVQEAKKLAFYIFWNVKSSHDVGHIEQSDLELFLSKERAADCFQSLDGDSNGKLSLTELRDAVIGIYESRKNLADTLRDTRKVVDNLERVMMVVVQFAFFFAYLAIFNVNLQKLWVTLGSIVVSLTFIFGNNVRAIYEAVVYLFVVNPYDVGDVVLVGPQQDWSTVKEIALQTTTFIKWDGSLFILPNTYLFANMLTNLSRSSDKAEVVRFMVDFGIDRGVVDRLLAVAKQVALDNPKEIKPEVTVTARQATDKDFVKFMIHVYWQFRFNGIVFTMPSMQRGEAAAAVAGPAVAIKDMDIVSQAATFSMMPSMITPALM